jgi:hypothetical protein
MGGGTTTKAFSLKSGMFCCWLRHKNGRRRAMSATEIGLM